MDDSQMISGQLQMALSEMEYLVRLLYGVSDYQTRILLLNQLWNRISLVQFLVGLSGERCGAQAAGSANARPLAATTGSVQVVPGGQNQAQTLPAITREQLSGYTGRSGNPAYVAVGGTVYDVTSNKAWSAASHFGLTAGNDLTQEFGSCHDGQQWILSTLTPVGRIL